MVMNCGAPALAADLPHVRIHEHAGALPSHATAGARTAAVSVASVEAKADAVEDWQTPDFDEWLVVHAGELRVESTHFPPVEARAGDTVFIPRGERTRAVLAAGVKYIAVCAPAFAPHAAYREEGSSADPSKARPPPHDAHVDVYHLVQAPLWERVANAADGEAAEYFPPTYEEDGFTHATADPRFLRSVANHFYRDTEAPWICLKMTRETIAKAGKVLKWEWPSPVGTTRPLDGEQSGGERFPHLFGGITREMVVETYDVKRSAEGEFLSIEGLC